ncbi:MAG: N-acetylmuramoyl-L-alanine amidase family protein [Bdellovibrionota bacterium]
MARTRIFHQIFFVLAALLAAPSAHAFRVVIDPGHGGADLGTVYSDGRTRVAEKDLTLALAHQVARDLKAKGVQVILTRTGDRELPLASRTSLANRLGADVFLSIHMNSTQEHGNADAEGIETYILNSTTDASSRRLAHIENSVISRTRPRSAEQADIALILKDLRLDANLPESKRLACLVQKNLVNTRGVKSRGVKQALFHVLLGADMPSVLVEAGFLSSTQDRSWALSAQGQKKMGQSIARSIELFRKTKNTRFANLTLSSCKVN